MFLLTLVFFTVWFLNMFTLGVILRFSRLPLYHPSKKKAIIATASTSIASGCRIGT
jgi:hypothetical protein